MPLTAFPVIALETLKDGISVLTTALAEFYKENCIICLDYANHSTHVMMNADILDLPKPFHISWIGNVTPQMKKAYANLIDATEHASCAIAMLIIREFTELTVVEQAVIRTTIDHYLALKSQLQDDTLIFNHTARLEVSGILAETEGNTLDIRLKTRLRRLKTVSDLPDYVVVVAFNEPRARMVKA
jgi:hypothetical protein